MINVDNRYVRMAGGGFSLSTPGEQLQSLAQDGKIVECGFIPNGLGPQQIPRLCAPIMVQVLKLRVGRRPMQLC